ncbi:hypothetical protein PVAP13_6NG105715 [Panicum virgatum]|uniref:Disease resistance R13L4/SHOC-2-like LRR domain-containing protein n=1 Tax=Panicum virgatum TaxID=38727 RepID=A0A8T0QX94_PANVG|nr:hypothetical protein PVAP13_6NG105715 [Panicum virgatum]
MILDLLCSLSREGSLVTIFDGVMASESSGSKVRRLSLQNRKEDHQTTPLDSSMDVSGVRSISIFEPQIRQQLPFSSFVVLRVLVLSGCYIGGNSLSGIGNLFHLRYLGLADTDICELPAEMEKLQFLQVLDARYNRNLKELPSSIYRLGKLMCLQVDNLVRLPDGLGNLASIEVLKEIRGASLNIVQELEKLSKLRELKIYFEYNMSIELEKAFVKSLSNLHNIEILTISGSFQSMDILGQSLTSHRRLRIFESVKVGKFSSLPAWIKSSPSPLSRLSELHIAVEVLQQDDLQILGRLPALRSFRIKSTHQSEKLLIGGFRCTTDFFLFCLFPLPVMFQPGALPMAQKVQITFGTPMEEDHDHGNVGFDMGLANLSSLQEVNVAVYCHGITVGEARMVEAKLTQALHDHHNHPRFKIDIQPPISDENEDIME